jgi:hypothetical protein
MSVALHKSHDEFHKLDMETGWQLPEGYDPNSGALEKILSGSLDTVNKRGSRTRLLKFPPGLFTKQKIVHDHWEEVFLVSGDLTVGNDENGRGGTPFAGYMPSGRRARGMARSNRKADACFWKCTTTILPDGSKICR